MYCYTEHLHMFLKGLFSDHVMALFMHFSLKLCQMDAKTTFLNGELFEGFAYLNLRVLYRKKKL